MTMYKIDGREEIIELTDEAVAALRRYGHVVWGVEKKPESVEITNTIDGFRLRLESVASGVEFSPLAADGDRVGQIWLEEAAAREVRDALNVLLGDQPKAPAYRVFVDCNGSRWFEVEPGWFVLGTDLADANVVFNRYDRNRYRIGQSLEDLEYLWGPLTAFEG